MEKRSKEAQSKNAADTTLTNAGKGGDIPRRRVTKEESAQIEKRNLQARADQRVLYEKGKKKDNYNVTKIRYPDSQKEKHILTREFENGVVKNYVKGIIKTGPTIRGERIVLDLGMKRA